MNRSIVPAVVVLLALPGCSGGNTPPAGPSTPKISIANEPSVTSNPDLATAANFVKAIYLADYDEAGTLAADNSVAARYVTHQQAVSQVDDLTGNPQDVNPSDVDVTPDEAKQSVAVEDRSGDKTTDYVWKNFTFSGQRIASWEVEGQARIDSRLWTTNSQDSSNGISAQLVSAYQGNSKALTVVVSIESGRKAIIETTSYTPDGGYKHDDARYLIQDLDKGKTLTYFQFAKAPIGGQVKIKIDTTQYENLTTLTLKIK